MAAELSLEFLEKLPKTDLHVNLDGCLRLETIIELAQPTDEAKFVIAHSEYGFTANIPIEYCLRDDCLIALRANGEPLTAEHGQPARLVVPRLYAWKSAKWLRGIEFSATDKPGFWERNGYHNRGDPWKEERYWGD